MEMCADIQNYPRHRWALSSSNGSGSSSSLQREKAAWRRAGNLKRHIGSKERGRAEIEKRKKEIID